MAPFGSAWPQIPALQGLLELYYGLIRLARVYGLWFTRERSKVRSLVRPPRNPLVLWEFLTTPQNPTRQLPAERCINMHAQSVRNPWNLFTHRSASPPQRFALRYIPAIDDRKHWPACIRGHWSNDGLTQRWPKEVLMVAGSASRTSMSWIWAIASVSVTFGASLNVIVMVGSCLMMGTVGFWGSAPTIA